MDQINKDFEKIQDYIWRGSSWLDIPGGLTLLIFLVPLVIAFKVSSWLDRRRTEIKSGWLTKNLLIFSISLLVICLGYMLPLDRYKIDLSPTIAFLLFLLFIRILKFSFHPFAFLEPMILRLVELSEKVEGNEKIDNYFYSFQNSKNENLINSDAFAKAFKSVFGGPRLVMIIYLNYLFVTTGLTSLLIGVMIKSNLAVKSNFSSSTFMLSGFSSFFGGPEVSIILPNSKIDIWILCFAKVLSFLYLVIGILAFSIISNTAGSEFGQKVSRFVPLLFSNFLGSNGSK